MLFLDDVKYDKITLFKSNSYGGDGREARSKSCHQWVFDKEILSELIYEGFKPSGEIIPLL